MNSSSIIALSSFQGNANCAQSILIAFATDEGLTAEQCLRLASGLVGGVGHKQHICGAINAGAMIIGLRFGNSNPNDTDAKQKATTLVAEYMDKCAQQLGSTDCHKMLGVDLNDPEAKQQARDAGLFEMVCGNAIKTVCQLLEEDFRKV
jgi:C_GCAxxG_C_C family probable redox protein